MCQLGSRISAGGLRTDAGMVKLVIHVRSRVWWIRFHEGSNPSPGTNPDMLGGYYFDKRLPGKRLVQVVFPALASRSWRRLVSDIYRS